MTCAMTPQTAKMDQRSKCGLDIIIGIDNAAD